MPECLSSLCLNMPVLSSLTRNLSVYLILLDRLFIQDTAACTHVVWLARIVWFVAIYAVVGVECNKHEANNH